MPVRKQISLVALAVAVVPAVTLAESGPIPSVDDPGLAQGPYASMHMLLEKTFLKIDVATIDVRFDKQAQGRFSALAAGKAYSDAVAQLLADVAINADRAVVQMRFVRDVPLKRWIGVVRDNLEQARAAGLIPREVEQRISAGLPQWFAALDKRGYEKGDRLLYAVTPESLRTVVVSAGGQVLIDLMDREQGARRVVLASYFAPRSDFREPLLRSLFGGGR